ncbi:MAG: acetyl-CoA carboxylase biotin carboxylase subunit [Rhodospirillaceae bacterium]|nr:acetyl-CoA carboxylase biotin carboxylase subunit [Rhodospirillaceae bacterium]|tara:strand:+ start:3107 stop:4456 length:1350 start_codon:yes stop_codon:yes gene_type:complete
MFDKVLIANRGEIALRINRACHEMGVNTVAVHSTVDADAMHVRLADESVCIGGASATESYLNIPAIITAAVVTNSDAIHPGYGFLSESAKFASIVEEHGIGFIGPTSEHIALMGDKIASKAKVKELGIPVVPGSEEAINDIETAISVAKSIGYPILVKASAGGGGRGMQIVREQAELESALSRARSEAGAAFGNDAVYIEKFLERPRHIEIQVMGDNKKTVLHFGERDCSLQRRHQKVLEEAGSPALNADERDTIGKTVCDALAELGYQNAGTVEFLYQDGCFYFIEMNTRLQVEHPVTEMVTGLDIVREQLRVAAGAPLGMSQKDINFSGHAIECRINAENPINFIPSPGQVTDYHPPGGLGVRVDSGLYSGYRVQPYYDSLVSKLIVYGSNRNECLMRLRRTLDEYVIGGIDSTIPLHQEIITQPDFINGEYDIHWLEKMVERRSTS